MRNLPLLERECSVCFEVLGDSDNGPPVELQCGGGRHCFHAGCLGRAWVAIEAQGGTPRCPLCRTDCTDTPAHLFAHAAVQSLDARDRSDAALQADAAAQTTWDALPPAPSCGRDIHDARPPGLLVAGAWDAVDDLTVFDAIVSPMPHLRDVPDALRGDWARANTEVFDFIAAAQAQGDPVALERGLKWYFVLHDALLRAPPRGSRGGGRATVD